MVLTYYDSIFVFKNYNILILYDYRYYCDFIILFNIVIRKITGVYVFGTHVRIRTPYILLIDAFELWCWRRLLRIAWTDINTNVWVIGNIKSEWTLESRIIKASLCDLGHVIRTGGMEYEVMEGRMGGYRSRGRPRQRWLDSIKKNFSVTIFIMMRASRYRRSWSAAVIDIAGVVYDSTAQITGLIYS